MSEWKTVKLGDIFDLQMGKTPDRKKLDYFQGSHKWISIADISKSEKYISETKEYLTDEAIASSGIKSIPRDTLIMSFKLSIGKTAITSDEMYSNEAIMAFLPNGKCETDNSFLYHLFSNKDWSEGGNKAVKGITLNKASLSEVKIPLPPLETQKHIAAVLDKCTALIAKYKLMLEKYDTLIKSRFIEMFGDPVTNSKKWNLKKLGDLLESIRYGTSTPPVFSETGYAFIRATNIKKGKIVNDDMKYISEEEAKKISKCKLNGNEILIVRSGVNSGDTCVVTKEYINQYAGYDMILVLGNQINPIYLNELLNTNYMEKMIKPLTRRAAQPHLNSEQTQSLPIILPPLSLQNTFAAFVQQIDKSKFAVQKSLEKAETLYKSLMQEYFG